VQNTRFYESTNLRSIVRCSNKLPRASTFTDSSNSILPNRVQYDPCVEEIQEIESEVPEYVVGSTRSRIEEHINNHMSLYFECLRDHGMMYASWDNVETRKRMVGMMMEALLEGEGESWLSVRWRNGWCEVTMWLRPYMLEDRVVACANWLLRGHLVKEIVMIDNPMYMCHDYWELVGSYIKKLPGPNCRIRSFTGRVQTVHCWTATFVICQNV
jgi:hypothetical protein